MTSSPINSLEAIEKRMRELDVRQTRYLTMSILSVFISFPLAMYFSCQEDINNTPKPLVYSISAWSVFLLCSVFLFVDTWGKRSRVKMQHEHELARQSPNPPILFLRSFQRPELTRGPLSVSSSSLDFGLSHSSTATYGGETLAYHIGEAVSELGRLVAIGNHTEAFWTRAVDDPMSIPEIGSQAYLISKEENWLEVFLEVVRASKFIIVIPETTTGIVREMKILKDAEFIKKILILMPPTPQAQMNESSNMREIYPYFRSRWNEVRSILAGKGIYLPVYNGTGMIYLPNLDFSVRISEPLSKIPYKEEMFPQVSNSDILMAIQTTIYKMLQSLPTVKGVPLNELVKRLEGEELAHLLQGKPRRLFFGGKDIKMS